MNLDTVVETDPQFLSSHESSSRRIHLYENMFMSCDSLADGWLIKPIRYKEIAEAYPDGLIDGRWRPQVYCFEGDGRLVRMGSQGELNLRWEEAGHPRKEVVDAELKAETFLLDHLREHQILEYFLTNSFTVKGGRTNNTYEVEVGDGFKLISQSTREIYAAYCLHTDYWMPDADIALATKLALECPDTEEDALNRAICFPRKALAKALYKALGYPEKAKMFPNPQRATRIQFYAADMERELI